MQSQQKVHGKCMKTRAGPSNHLTIRKSYMVSSLLQASLFTLTFLDFLLSLKVILVQNLPPVLLLGQRYPLLYGLVLNTVLSPTRRATGKKLSGSKRPREGGKKKVAHQYPFSVLFTRF